MEKALKEKLVRERSSQQLTTESTFGQGSSGSQLLTQKVTSSPDEFGALLRSLEKEGEQKTYTALSDPSANANTFLNILREGAKEFEQKTGKTMTYSEMRAIYG